MRTALIVMFARVALAQQASPPPSPQPMVSGRQLIRELQERVARLEAAQARAEPRAGEIPLISFGPTGMMLRTPDGKTSIQTRGLVQADGRAYLGDGSHSLNDTFLLRPTIGSLLRLGQLDDYSR